MLFFKSVPIPMAAAFAACFCCFKMAKGQTPPNVTGKSNAPTGVPEYVVKYGRLLPKVNVDACLRD
jgi:hypothetical protein